MSFVEKIKRQRSKVYYIKTIENNLECHYFIIVQKDKLDGFNRSLESSEKVNISDYGEVLYQIKGQQIPKFVKEEMQKKYNFDI